MKNIKKYWREILLGLFVIFSLNRCTIACNRDSQINKQKIELIQKDSIVKVQGDSLTILNIRWNDAQNSQTTYQGIALDTKQELINQVNILESEKKSLNERIKKLELENKNLKNEIVKLKQ